MQSSPNSPPLQPSRAPNARAPRPVVESPVLRLPEVLAYLNLGNATLYRLIERGEIPKGTRFTRGRTGVVRWFKADLDAFLETKRAEGRP